MKVKKIQLKSCYEGETTFLTLGVFMTEELK